MAQRNILNIVFAPKKRSEITSVDDPNFLSWEQSRKQMLQYYAKPVLLGNPKFSAAPLPYPIAKAPDKNKALRQRIYLWYGDITKLKIQCIVNSANIKLKYGGGICGAIHRAAGAEQLGKQMESKYPNGANVMECVISDAFQLPATYIIHCVGPTQSSNDLQYQLSTTYKNCLRLAIKHGITQICLCCIGCGTHSLPIKEAAKIAIYSVVKWLTEPVVMETPDQTQENEDNDDEEKSEVNEKRFGYQCFDKIVFNCFTEPELEAYKVYLQEQLG